MGEGKHLCPSFDPSRRGLYLVVIIGGENRLSRTKFVSNVKQSFNIVDGVIRHVFSLFLNHGVFQFGIKDSSSVFNCYPSFNNTRED
jgi:hypothetical protein